MDALPNCDEGGTSGQGSRLAIIIQFTDLSIVSYGGYKVEKGSIP
jgi:hypothetical protein